MRYKVLVLFLLLSANIFSDDDIKISNEYNLVRCLLTALEKSSSFKKVALDKKIAEIELKASGANFEWILSTTTSYTDTNDLTSQTVGVNKNFVTGTTVGISTTVSDQSGIVKDKASSLSFNLTQELLAGATVKENDLPIFRAKIKNEQLTNRLEEQIRSVLYKVSSNYFQYIKSEETIKINFNALKQSKKFLETVQELKKAGKGTNLDIATAEVQVSAREEAVLQSQTTITNALDVLKRSMGVDMDEIITIQKEISLEVILPHLTYDEAYLHAINNRSDMIIAKLNIELLNRELIAKSYGKKPNLKLSYSANFLELDDEFGGAYHYSDSPEHILSLTFSTPLMRKRKIADYLSAKATNEKSEIELWELTQDIKLDIKRIMREIEESIKTLEVQKQRVKTEEIRVQSFETRFENGLIDSLEVTRAYDDLDKARIDLINSKLNLKILVSEYHNVLGSQPTIILENEKSLLKNQPDKK